MTESSGGTVAEIKQFVARERPPVAAVRLALDSMAHAITGAKNQIASHESQLDGLRKKLQHWESDEAELQDALRLLGVANAIHQTATSQGT